MQSIPSLVRRSVSRFSALTLVSHIVLSSAVAALPIFATPAFAASLGPNNGSTFANETSVGTVDWKHESDAQTSNDDYADANVDDNEISNYLKTTGFGFAVPSGATIDGIKVEVERKADDASRIKDSSVRLVKGGVIGGNNKADTATFWGTSDAYVTYGSSTDLWGQTWTPADINASTFGTVLSVKKDTTAGGKTKAKADHIRITAYYTLPQGSVTIVKQTIPDGAAGSFNFTGTGFGEGSELETSLLSDGASETDSTVTPASGVYHVAETVPAGWTLTSILCDDANSDSEGGASVDINVESGEHVTCTFTNTKTPKLTIVKVLDPANDAGKFNLSVNGTQYATNVGNNGTTGAQFATIGANTFAEAAGTATNLSDYASAVSGTGCGGTATAGTITLAAGDDKTCTITNTKNGTIIITKNAIPDDAQDFTFTSTITGNTSFSLDDDADGTLSNTKTILSVPVGSYTVTDPTVTGWTLTGLTCTGGGANTTTSGNVATIGVDAGETVTCTFTNTKLGTVTIIKNAIPDDPQDFSFAKTLGDGEGFMLDDDGETGSPTPSGITFSNLALGDFTVTEAAVPGWSLTGLTCTGGDADGSTNLTTGVATIGIDAGESITCTYTNTKHSSLTIKKYALGGDGSFGITWSGNSSSASSNIATTAGYGTMTITDLFPTTYAVTEQLPGAEGEWNQYSNTCNNITLQPGATSTCTIINRKRTRISVAKETTNDGAQAFDFTTTIGSSSSSFQRTVTGPGLPVGQNSFFDVFADVSFGSSSSAPTAQAIPIEMVELNLSGWNFKTLACTRNDVSLDVSTTNSHGNIQAQLSANAGDVLACLYTNVKSVCGNGVIQNAEQCDDGNTTAADGCGATCQIESGWACANEPSACTPNCGDGQVLGSETCDDGNLTNNDGCSSVCQNEYCGDGAVNRAGPEGVLDQCDDGNTVSGDGCNASCRNEYCGDGIIQTGIGEVCDDGGALNNDGCSSSCHVETGFRCVTNTVVQPNSTCETYLDFGDAPDEAGEGEGAGIYPTLLEHDGARHAIVDGFLLGNEIDDEPDGQPNADATNDGHDEDGITMPGSVAVGGSFDVSAIVKLPGGEGSAFVDGWFDFNNDHDWDEGEHVIHALKSQGTHTFTVSVPSDAHLGQTFARFRLSNSEVLGPTGMASIGEVEDYMITFFNPSDTGPGVPDQPAEPGPTGDTSGGTSGRTSRTLFAIARNAANQSGIGQLPGGAFGGGDVPFSPEAVEYLCSMQRALPHNSSIAVKKQLALYIANFLNLDPVVVFDALIDPDLCKEIDAALRPSILVAEVESKPFVIDGNGFPVSGNDTWNACFRAINDKLSFPKEVIKDNIETDKDGTPRDCAYYNSNSNGEWLYPDYNITFKYNKGTKTYTLPKGYTATRPQRLTQK